MTDDQVIEIAIQGPPTKLLSDSQLDKLIISEWGKDACLPAMRRFARVVEKAVKNN
jgi:hypothetical protein